MNDPSKDLTPEDMMELLEVDAEISPYKTISEEICGQDRWTTMYAFIITDGERFWEFTWTKGSTEYQENQDFEKEPPEFTEMEAVVETVTVYKPKKMAKEGDDGE